MLDNPNADFDRPRMLEIFQDVMEDTINFGWDRARSFYDMVGLDVEHKKLDWNDRQELLKMRLTHVRSGFASNQVRNQKSPNAAIIKTYAPFQTGACDNTGDHGAFKHLCDYCLRVRNMSFPHPEGECKTKSTTSQKTHREGVKCRNPPSECGTNH